MNIGIPPIHDKISDVDPPNGFFGNTWVSFFTQIVSQLNRVFTNLGYYFPGVSSTKLSAISGDYAKSITFNDDTNRMQLNNSGTFQAIQTAEIFTQTEILAKIAAGGANGIIFGNSTDNSLIYAFDENTIYKFTGTQI